MLKCLLVRSFILFDVFSKQKTSYLKIATSFFNPFAF